GLHCEAVLEHLEEPARAVAEMARVLRRGGRVFAATPFLQAFHGYPDHFQNLTTSGHRRLFERSGLTVVEAGACVGPAFALADLLRNFLRSQVPGGAVGKVAARAVWPLTLPFRWLDAYLLRRPSAALLCSTTYLVAAKG
ncbi:MAG: methyltransferase domain-containing protein, partial [Thermoanaerobaculia bacterium]|nr:methyltransferase domain-containing protein [Thermoanaerobaculia bacterium]